MPSPAPHAAARRVVQRSLLCLALLASAAPVSGCAWLLGSGPPGSKAGEPPNERITYAQLQTRLMTFSERYLDTLERATDAMLAGDPRAETRRRTRLLLVKNGSAVIAVASEPNPELALLDMTALVRLQKEIASEGEALATYGPQSSHLLAAYAELDQTISRLAEAVLSPAQAEELGRLIAEWRRQHPEESDLGPLRFHEFAETRARTMLVRDEAQQVQSFLAPIDEARLEVTRTQMLGERALYLAQQLPRVMRWEVEAAGFELMGQPETRAAIDSVQRMALETARLASIAERLPAQLNGELGGQERALRQLLEATRTTMAEMRTTMGEMRGTLTPFGDVVDRTRASADALVASSAAIEKVLARFAGEGDPRFDLDKLLRTTEALGSSARDAEHMLGVAERLAGSPAAIEGLEKAEAHAKALVDHAAWRALEVVLAACALLGLTGAGLMWWKRKLQSTQP